MSYGYNIIRNGITIPLTQVFAGYNAGGTTSGFNGMGSFTSAISNYRKQNPVGFQQNGTDISNIYEANYVSGSPGSTTYITIPTGCSAIRYVLIGGGGGGGASNPYAGFGGGGGGVLISTLYVSGGTITLKVGSGGSANSGNGGTTSLEYAGSTYNAFGGIGGSSGTGTGYVGGYGGAYTLNGSDPYYYASGGDNGGGNLANSNWLNGPLSNGYPIGGYSGIQYAPTPNFDIPFTNVGRGGDGYYGGPGPGQPGTGGYGSVHFLY